MKLVALIRNINVGQRGFPSRLQLEQAFMAAGAHSAVSFQSNGTVVTELNNSISLASVHEGVREYLRTCCNFTQALFLRDLEAIRVAVRQDPYAAIDHEGYPHQYVSYYEFAGSLEGIFPLESAQKDCLVFRGTGQEAYSVARDNNRGVSGYPTPLLESRLNVPVTTRSWTTMVRLIGRF
jgi:uncharacterized protein (DUF1697 family)